MKLPKQSKKLKFRNYWGLTIPFSFREIYMRYYEKNKILKEIYYEKSLFKQNRKD